MFHGLFVSLFLFLLLTLIASQGFMTQFCFNSILNWKARTVTLEPLGVFSVDRRFSLADRQRHRMDHACIRQKTALIQA